MKLRQIVAVISSLLIGLLALGLAACGNEEPESEVLNLGYADLSGIRFDPIYTRGILNPFISLIYDNLVGGSLDGSPSKNTGIAKDWEPNADSSVWTYDIRTGIKFTSGDELSAEDVKWSLERMASEEANTTRAANWRGVLDHVEVVSSSQVKVHLTRPEPNIAVFLSDTLGRIMNQSYFEEVGPEVFDKEPDGSGPYTLVNWSQGDFVELAAKEDHWLIGTPHYARVITRAVPEPLTRLAMLRRGELDFAPISIEVLGEARAASEIKVVTSGPTSASCLLLTEQFREGSPQADPEVRKALALAIDHETLLTSIYPEGSVKLTGAIYGRPLNREVPVPGYDPARAKQMLAGAGYPNGFAIDVYTYVFSTNNEYPLLMEGVAQYFREIGLDVTTVPGEYAAFRGDWVAHEVGTAAAPIDGLSGTEGNPGEHGTNYGFMLHSNGIGNTVNDAELDRLIDAANSATSADVYNQKMNEAGERAIEIMACIPLGDLAKSFAINPDNIREGFEIGAAVLTPSYPERRMVGQAPE